MKKFFSAAVLIIVALTPNLYWGQSNSELAQLLPVEFGNWKLESEPEQYAGDDLFFLINGGADLFLEYGFTEVISAKYVYDENFIRIEIYEMEDHKAAFGIFTMKKYPNGSWINIGDSGSFLDSYLIFVKEKYTVIISASDSDEHVQNDINFAARQIDDKIAEEGKLSDIFRILPQTGLIPNSIKYMEGLLGLNSIYIFGYSNVFEFDECITAEYDNHTLLIMGYQNDSASRNGYNNALKNFKEGTKFSDFSDLMNGSAFKDKSENHLTMQLLGRYILITVSGTEIDYSKIFEEIKRITN